MGLKLLGHVELPAHEGPGGFDHAAVHRARSRTYVAHTSNHALDVVDCASDRYLHSIGDLPGVAGALVSEEHNLVFTSNRAGNSVGVFSPDSEGNVLKISVGVGPNGLAYAPTHHLLLAANVGDPSRPDGPTVSIVAVEQQAMIADIPVPGRTRWAVYDTHQDTFFVNIADPPQIIVVEAANPTQIRQAYPIPAGGPHGLDIDAETDRLFCACDGRRLVVLDARNGRPLAERELGGAPDVVFFNPSLHHLYVAIGDPGLVEVWDSDSLERRETVPTENGAHTFGIDPDRHKIYVFLPHTHRAAVYRDTAV